MVSEGENRFCMVSEEEEREGRLWLARKEGAGFIWLARERTGFVWLARESRFHKLGARFSYSGRNTKIRRTSDLPLQWKLLCSH